MTSLPSPVAVAPSQLLYAMIFFRLFSTYQENCETKDLEIQSLKQKLEEFR